MAFKIEPFIVHKKVIHTKTFILNKFNNDRTVVWFRLILYVSENDASKQIYAAGRQCSLWWKQWVISFYCTNFVTETTVFGKVANSSKTFTFLERLNTTCLSNATTLLNIFLWRLEGELDIDVLNLCRLCAEGILMYFSWWLKMWKGGRK